MQFISAKTPQPGIDALAGEIISSLKKGKPVLWLVPGGSNIPISAEVMNIIRREVPTNDLSGLTITLTDERYGPVDHADSNWQQLKKAWFGMHKSIEGPRFIPVLIGMQLDETVNQWGIKIRNVFEEVKFSSGLIIGQFGMGADGHIAGILPHSPATVDSSTVCAYESKPFTRITLTFNALKMLDQAYLFAFGDSKKQALDDLRDKDLLLVDQPAQILKSIPKAFVYCD